MPHLSISSSTILHRKFTLQDSTMPPESVGHSGLSPCSSRSESPKRQLTAGLVLCCTFRGRGRSTEEKKMRRAFVSIQRVTFAYSKDMKPYANLEPRNPGACRRW